MLLECVDIFGHYSKAETKIIILDKFVNFQSTEFLERSSFTKVITKEANTEKKIVSKSLISFRYSKRVTLYAAKETKETLNSLISVRYSKRTSLENNRIYGFNLFIIFTVEMRLTRKKLGSHRRF